MRQPPKLCPVHEYERLECDDSCAWARRELSNLCRDFRVLWYDRRRGVPVRHFRDPRPVWAAWASAA